ncbi:MAG TPA: carboxymuconolactone decarboxylase family protein [Nocardioides sp.]|nr:carboxymuconolactone decarboxylase family protein [Nocardioides sp.]
MTEQTHTHGRSVLHEIVPLGRNLRQHIPEVYAGYAEISKAAMSDGALERKTKQLIALAIGVVEHCDGCIAAHAQGAARAGATKQEVAEAIGVTFMMHGGPATVWGARAFDAFVEFAEPPGQA